MPEIPAIRPIRNSPLAAVSRVFLLDKPAGLSSFAGLGALKRAIGTKKVGHAGTLDPFATGLLIAASGKMTKTAGMLTNMDKEYVSVFRFGQETDTLDTEGTVIETAPVPEIDAIETAAASFRGPVTQTPPIYSAVKIDGQRAYKQARAGRAIDVPERNVIVHDLELISWEVPRLTVRIRCSKGTYIRSIARDLALAVGSRAYCEELRRTAIGPFCITEARNPEEIDGSDGMTPGVFFDRIGIPAISVGAVEARLLRSGVPFHRMPNFRLSDSPLVFYSEDNGNPAALIERNADGPSYRIVFD